MQWRGKLHSKTHRTNSLKIEDKKNRNLFLHGLFNLTSSASFIALSILAWALSLTLFRNDWSSSSNASMYSLKSVFAFFILCDAQRKIVKKITQGTTLRMRWRGEKEWGEYVHSMLLVNHLFSLRHRPVCQFRWAPLCFLQVPNASCLRLF